MFPYNLIAIMIFILSLFKLLFSDQKVLIESKCFIFCTNPNSHFIIVQPLFSDWPIFWPMPIRNNDNFLIQIGPSLQQPNSFAIVLLSNIHCPFGDMPFGHLTSLRMGTEWVEESRN